EGWSFLPQMNLSDHGSGIARIGGPWGGTAAGGRQFAFLQRDGFLDQTMSGLSVGQRYHVLFSQSSRPGFGHHQVRVLVNGSVVLGPVSGTANTWTPWHTNDFIATAPKMSLRFEGLDPGGDTASLIDDVSVVPEPE